MTIIEIIQNKMQQRKVNSNRATIGKFGNDGLVDDRRCF